MTPEELQRFGERVNSAPRQKALSGLEGDSDAAAQAVELEQSTGTPAQTIYQYNDRFVKDYKGFLTQRMLDRNPGLAGYIESHPMAAIVSKDDWNRMADFYDHMDYYMDSKLYSPIKAVGGAVYGFLHKFAESADEAKLGSWIEKQKAEFAEKGQPWNVPAGVETAAKIAAGPFEGAMVFLSSLVHGAAGAGEGAATALGASGTEARMWGRRLGAAAEFFGTDLAAGGLYHPPAQAVVQKMMVDRAFKLGKQYLDAGELPPPGIHPIWDGVVRAETERKMSVYDALVDAANKTDTKEISPQLMEIAAAVKARNEQLYIHWDAVKELYGDKLPEAGDGMLGDVPGVIEQFRNAIDTATDIQVPLATWISKVDPEVVKQLHDDIRFRPGDPTLREVEAFPKLEQAVQEFAKPVEAPAEPAPLPEPPLERLSRLKIEYADRLATHGALEHAPTPEGNLLQSLAAVTGKTYEADKVSNAVRWGYLNQRADIVDRALELAKFSDDGKLYARLRTELDNLNRYSGALDAIETEMGQKSPLGWETAETGPLYPTISELLRSPEWKKVGEITVAKVHGDLAPHEAIVKKMISVLFERLGGPEAGVKLLMARELRMGEPTPYPITASYVMGAKYGAKEPTASILLGAIDPVNSLGHEFMHHLRRYKFLRDSEWAVLAKLSDAEWVDKFRIRERYDPTKAEFITEEGVTHEFGEWYSKRVHADPRVQTIFTKIADFIDKVRVMLKELFGRDLTADEIFERIYRGEVGRREPTGPPEARYGARPLEREAAQKPPEIEVPKIEAEGLLGLLPKGRELKYLKLINAKNAKDVQHLFDQHYKDELKRQTPAWKRAYGDQYAQSIAELKNRPDFRAAAFFRSGVIMGEKLKGLPKLDPRFLSKEQRNALPDTWFRQRDGFAPDDIAGYLGYPTGEEMINDLVRFEQAKGRMKPETFLDLQAATEAERRMQRQFGDLEENVLNAAREHAIGLERFDLMHEEYIELGTKLGQQMPLSKQDIRDQEFVKFNDTINSQVSLIKYTREIGKSNKAAEKAWLSGDVAGAYMERQRTLRLEALAEQAKKFEKDQATYIRNRNRFKKREVEGMPPEFTNWIHHIFNRVGEEIRSPADLATEIAAQEHQTLKEFVDSRSTIGLPEGFEEFGVEVNPNIPIWERLVDEPDFTKHIHAMTVGEFRAVNESIKALIKIGRDELSTYLAGVRQNRADVIDRMVAQANERGEAVSGGKKRLPDVGDPNAARLLKKTGLRLMAGLLQMEYMWGRLDGTPYGGIYYKHFTKPFSEAGNEFRLLISEYSKKLTALGKETTEGVSMRERIPNTVLKETTSGFEDRFLGGGYLSRREFRAVMLNIGLTSGLEKLARGYHATPEDVMAWINKHATEKDWAFVRGIWDAFNDIQAKTDLVSRNMTGVAMERLPIPKIMTKFGEIDGGYYPIIYDQGRGGGKKAGQIDPNTPPLQRVLTERGFEQKRTNYVGPIDLSLSHLEHQITRRLRDIAFREVLVEAHKFFTNKRFRDGITTNLGEHHTNLLIPYLRDIAGVRGPTSAVSRATEALIGWLHQNTITAFVGMNPGTLLKHTPTAAVQSLKELKNPAHFLAAAHDLYTGAKEVREANHKFIMEGEEGTEFRGSGEIKGRRPNWNEALGGATDIVMGKMSIRARAQQVLSWPVASSDQAASKILWLAKYREVMEELQPKMAYAEAQSEAVAIADQSVRRSHGSTAITSRPEFMRMGGLMRPLTALYGFFNHVLNRLYEISWEGREFGRDLTKGEATPGDAKHLALQFFYAVVVPAAIEEAVTPLFDKEGRSYGVRLLMSLGFPVTSSFPVIREIAHAVFTGHDPGFGIIQGSIKAASDLIRVRKKLNKEEFGDVLQAVNTLLGVATGVSSQQLGRWQKFGYNYAIGKDRPRSKEEWYRVVRYGASKERRH